MNLDVGTVVSAIGLVALFSGAFLIVVGRQFRAAPASAIWGIGNIFTAAGVPILLATSLSDIGFLCIMASGACYWASVATFFHRRFPFIAIGAGLLVWLVASLAPVGLNYGERGSIFVLLTGLYLLGAAVDLAVRGRREQLSSRWPLLAMAAIDSVACLLGATQVLSLTDRPVIPAAGGLWVVYGLVIVFIVGSAFFLVAMIKERAIADEELAASTDSLTGIANRSALMKGSTAILARSLAANVPVSVIAFDLDRFKAVNDTYGHHMGDVVLKLFAEGTRRCMRTTDLFGRIGGEEFVAVIPAAGREFAATVAERIRATFAETARTVDGRPVQATVSCGIALVAPGRQPPAVFADVLARADAALYAAKAAGRDCIVFDTDIPDPPNAFSRSA